MAQGREKRAVRVLYTSADLHAAIKYVLGSPQRGERRVALVAYVGGGAEAFLPDVKGMEIVCSLTPGATSAEALIRLRERGAELLQSPGLHMKVYWSSKKGAVIGSANASRLALGRDASREAGVLLPSESVDVERLMQYARPRPIRDEDLRRLARQSDRLAATRPKGLRDFTNDDIPTLSDWLSTPGRKGFKICATRGELSTSKTVKAQAKQRFGVVDPHAFVGGLTKANELRPGDWVLVFDARTGREAEWLYVDFVVRLRHSELHGYRRKAPYEAVQVNPNRDYPSPPFRLDRTARKAITNAATEIGGDVLERSTSIPRRLYTLLRQHVSSQRLIHALVTADAGPKMVSNSEDFRAAATSTSVPRRRIY